MSTKFDLTTRVARFKARLEAYTFHDSPLKHKLDASHKWARYQRRLNNAIAQKNEAATEANLNKIEAYLARLTRNVPPVIHKKTYGFFQQRAAIDISQKTAIVASFISRINKLLSSISFHKFGDALQAIPFIGLIMGSISPFYNFIKAAWKGKSLRKIIPAAIISIAFIGMIVVASINLPIAAGIATLALVAIGAITNNFIPLYQSTQKISRLAQELNENINPDLTSSLPLSPKEKLFVMTALTYHDDLMTAKALPTPLSYKSLSKAIPHLPDLLTARLQSRTKQIHKEIDRITALQRDQKIRAANATLTIIGAICFCIPTPPTIILGLSILVASGIVGIAIEFDIGTKLVNFTRWLLGNKKSSPTPLRDTTKALLATPPTIDNDLPAAPSVNSTATPTPEPPITSPTTTATPKSKNGL